MVIENIFPAKVSPISYYDIYIFLKSNYFIYFNS